MKVYQHAAGVLTSVREESKGFKTAFYDYHKQWEWDIGTHITRVYSIAINTYQHMGDIEAAIDAVVDPSWELGLEETDMLKVLVYEAVIHGQRLRMGGRLPKIVKTHLAEFKDFLSGKAGASAQRKRSSLTTAVYIRPNKHKDQAFTLGEVRSKLKEEGFKVRKFGHLGLIRVIDNKAQGRCIATHPLIKDLQYLIQDLSSCLPIIYLKSLLEQSEVDISQLKVLDATAAPGNKTLQVSEVAGEVLSYEKDENRFKVLKKRVHECRARNVTVMNEDFLEAKNTFSDVGVVICDPSCSGSGMKLHSASAPTQCSLELETPEEQRERASNLSKFQFKILSHALTEYQDSAKYVVYSTCSVYREENEQVIKDVLKKSNKDAESQQPIWKTVDLSQVDVGLRTDSSYMKGFHFDEELGCLRICGACGPKEYLNGFFLAIFERI